MLEADRYRYESILVSLGPWQCSGAGGRGQSQRGAPWEAECWRKTSCRAHPMNSGALGTLPTAHTAADVHCFCASVSAVAGPGLPRHAHGTAQFAGNCWLLRGWMQQARLPHPTLISALAVPRLQVHEFGHAVMDLGLHGNPLRVRQRLRGRSGRAHRRNPQQWLCTCLLVLMLNRPPSVCAPDCDGGCVCHHPGQDAIIEAYQAAPRRRDKDGGSSKGRHEAAAGGTTAPGRDSTAAAGEANDASEEGWAGYDPSCYMMANECEYWAEGSQAWFDATVREGESCRAVARRPGRPRSRRQQALQTAATGAATPHVPHARPRGGRAMRRMATPGLPAPALGRGPQQRCSLPLAPACRRHERREQPREA